jgi:tetratricopeptide (TPR) repeat protein
MGGSEKKRNPDLFQTNSGYDEPFVSKFHYYLSANKIDFSMMRQKKGQQPVTRSREIFNTYPIYLQHSLFFNGEDYKKVRGIECCSRFLPYEKLREKGNKYFNKGKYIEALDYYERALSLFKWLEYFEEDNTEKSLSKIPSQQSIESSENLSVNEESKVHINLKNSEEETSEDVLEKDEQFEEMKTKYKEFFVVYTDGNVKLCDGEDMEDAPDVDMRKSLMLQVLLNMSAVYCHLHHYSLALQCIEDCFMLSDKVSQIYLRKAQALIFNKSCTLEDAQEAKRCMEKALELKSTEKIFQSNENILKMVNLHNAGEAYQKALDLVNQKIEEKSKEIEALRVKIYERAKEINEVEKRLIS